MKANVGTADKNIRLVLGVVIILLGIFLKSWWGLIGIIPIITALLNFCPVWRLLGISTKKKVETEKLKV
ncbi:MAG TPA: DUF2892 domain-containing protein [Ignavibacteriaceae bacterium]|jgi:hypothetical protein|nr:MAG: hypothetical protein BWY38_01768 [Ignavibacteria bacterium ADurb.Bin266]OQY69599.1 MAG: hypothetical protein B6D44_17580 [Ignavibacteriales bacterium UTCHB2]HQF43111.1 DUF2892 domain-containing protein [Ignavibacteriaceae bacterium]HQI40502.1 DUF2892 domain-containing protein [Ignavibacteriaceae bacterium]HQJ46291.1 DUF2892 domain-containing protein [Ignavibacteriaceae bacterium]